MGCYICDMTMLIKNKKLCFKVSKIIRSNFACKYVTLVFLDPVIYLAVTSN